MDYVVFSELCSKQNTTPTALTLKLGLSKGNANSWKKGGNPSVDVLIKLADELNCTVDLLLGRHQEKLDAQELSTDEQRLLHMYSLLSDMEKGEILGELKAITSNRENIKKNDNLQTVLIAARSSDHHPPELVTGDFSDIINAPDATDEY